MHVPHGRISRGMGHPHSTPHHFCELPIGYWYCRYHHATWEGPAGPDALCHQPGRQCGSYPMCLSPAWLPVWWPSLTHVSDARRPSRASASPQTIEDFDFTFTAPEGGFRSGWTGRAELLTGGRVLGESLSSMGFGQWAWRLGAWVPGSIALLGDRDIDA